MSEIAVEDVDRQIIAKVCMVEDKNTHQVPSPMQNTPGRELSRKETPTVVTIKRFSFVQFEQIRAVLVRLFVMF